jgi:hypothetical protein
MAQIAAKAVLKPIGRYCALESGGHWKYPNHALTGFLGGLAAIFKRWITVDWTSPHFPKVG